MRDENIGQVGATSQSSSAQRLQHRRENGSSLFTLWYGHHKETNRWRRCYLCLGVMLFAARILFDLWLYPQSLGYIGHLVQSS